MKNLVIIFLLCVATPSLAQDPNTQKQSTPTNESDLGKFNDGTSLRDQPRQAISHPCPYTCNDAGFSQSGCREWQDGDTCYIGPKLDSSPKSAN